MATIGERLKARLERKIDQDGYEDDSELYDMLSQGLKMAAELLKLPGLQMTDEVSTVTSGNMIDLPADYHHGLFNAYLTDTKDQIEIVNDWATLLRLTGTSYADSGDVSMICDNGAGQLVYDKIPAAATDITLFYYRAPADITYRTTALDGVPASIAARMEKAIVHYAAYLAFEDLENGVEGQKIDTGHNLSLFESIIDDIQLSIAPVSLPPPTIVRGEFI